MVKAITVFCGSSAGDLPAYRSMCRRLASALHARGISLIYGGGKVGLMGVLADEMLHLGGTVIGVIPRKLVDIEVAHEALPEMHVVSTMHERKALMTRLADAFLILPGGIGTMDELFEVLTWRQLGYHDKAVGLLNVEGYYDRLIGFLDDVVQHGFLSDYRSRLLFVSSDLEELLDLMLKSGEK